MTDIASTGLQLRSLVEADGTLRLSLETIDVPAPGDGEVVVRVEAAPINPSDLGLLFGGADMPRRRPRAGAGGDGDGAGLARCAASPGRSRRRIAAGGQRGRWQGGRRRFVGGGAGAARPDRRRARWGDVLAVPLLDAAQCLQLPGGVTAAEGAACFVNPLTALGHGRHDAPRGPHRPGPHRRRVQPRPDAQPAVHGRRHRPGQHRPPPEQEQLLRCRRRPRVRLDGAAFPDDLTDALRATGATIAFDAIGGGAWPADPGVHGGGARDGPASTAATARRPQAGVHLRRTRPGPDRAEPNFGMAWASADGC